MRESAPVSSWLPLIAVEVAYSFGCTFCGLYDAIDDEDLCAQGEYFMRALMCLPIPMKLPFCDSDYPKGVEARIDLLGG